MATKKATNATRPLSPQAARTVMVGAGKQLKALPDPPTAAQALDALTAAVHAEYPYEADPARLATDILHTPIIDLLRGITLAEIFSWAE